MSKPNLFHQHASKNSPPPTRWSIVRRAAATNQPDAMQALEELCRLYQQPIQIYILAHGFSADDAEDARQEFFKSILASNAIAAADETKYRFRAFIFQKLKSFLIDYYRKNQAKKRGGGKVVLFCDLSEEQQSQANGVEYQTPFLAAQMRWMETLMQRALAAVQYEYEAKGLGERFTALIPFILRENEITLATLAIRFDRSIANLKSDIFRLRAKCMQSIRLEIAATLEDATEPEIDAELGELMGYRSNRSPG